MKASDFAARYAKASQVDWEEAAVQAAAKGDAVKFPYVEVPLKPPPSLAGHSASVFVTSDVFTLGEEGDSLRIPLTPGNAQRVANLQNAFLPTRKLAQDIFAASTARIEPLPQANKGPNLAQYIDYDRKVDQALENAGAKFGQLVSGHKKDIVISKGLKPGKLAIFGWYKLNGERIQPLSDVHDDRYADYSHGVRFIAPDMKLDGDTVKLETVLQDPKVSGFVSDQGPLLLRELRYPSSNTPKPVPDEPPPQVAKPTLYALGLETLLSLTRKLS